MYLTNFVTIEYRYIKQFLTGPAELDTDVLRSENSDLRQQVETLSARVDELTKRLLAAGITPPSMSETAGLSTLANTLRSSTGYEGGNPSNPSEGGLTTTEAGNDPTKDLTPSVSTAT